MKKSNVIQLVHYKDHKGCIEAIEFVPESAIEIIQKYEPLLTIERSVQETDGTYSEFSDLTFDEARQLQKELIAAGHRCDFTEYDPDRTGGNRAC